MEGKCEASRKSPSRNASGGGGARPSGGGGAGSSGLSDWLWDFGRKGLACTAIYLLGYTENSTAWLLMLVCFWVARDHWKSQREGLLSRHGNVSEKEMVLARVEDLPSWVFFPDVERVEWINRILRQVWPNVNHYAKALLVDVIEPNLKDNLKPYKLGSFRFEKVVLGSISPRIGGIKVYEKNVSREEIVLDMDLFYSGDCDIRIRVGGIPAGIKDIQVQGMVRVVLKPLITAIPFIGGMQFFFLNNPKIDFNLVGVADVFDMPGVSELMRRIVTEQVAGMMVLPNKYTMKLVDDIPTAMLRVPEPEGVLRVRVIEARQLMKMDVGVLGMGKSDPYAIVTVGAQQFRTKVISNTVKPYWDYTCEIPIDSGHDQRLDLAVMDHDDSSLNQDDFLGRATVDIYNVVKKGQHDLWVPLEDVKSGMVHLEMTWLNLTTNPADLAPAVQDIHGRGIHAAAVIIFIDSAKNLPNARQNSKPDPYCAVGIGCSVGSQIQQTPSALRTGDPVWETGFVFLVRNPESDDLHVRVVDSKTGSDLGHLKVVLSTLLERENMSLVGEPQMLKGAGPDARLFLNVHLKIMKLAEPSTTSDEEDEEEGESAEALHESESIMDSPAVSSSSRLQKESDTSSSMKSSDRQSPLDDDTEEGLRKRNIIGAGQFGIGKVQVTLRYSNQRQQLIIVLHKAVNLAEGDDGDLPDPYAKLYLLPDRSKESKRKTAVMKDNCNPLYDETFEFALPPSEVAVRKLEVTVVSKKGFFAKSPVLGLVVIELSTYDLSKAVTEWFDLRPLECSQ